MFRISTKTFLMNVHCRTPQKPMQENKKKNVNHYEKTHEEQKNQNMVTNSLDLVSESH